MSRPRGGVAAAVCTLGLVTAACGGKTPATVSIPSAPAPKAVVAVSSPVESAQPAPLPSWPATWQPAIVVPPPTLPAGRLAAVKQPQLAEFQEQQPEPAPIDQLLTITTTDTPVPTPSTAVTVADDLSEIAYDIDIPLNPRVLSYVELFSGRLKNYLEDGLNRGGRYLPMIQDIFREEGVPLDLAYVPLVESAFKPNAVSKAKARGMWQFMHGTALENGLEHDWYIDERTDPEKATRAAAKYLKTLYAMFDDWHLALASYNGGPGRVQRAMRQSGKDDFWELSSSKKYLPQETRDYVPLVLAAVVVARNPSQYGMTMLEPQPAPAVDRVILAKAVDLRRVAEWVGAPLQTIQDLNPELRRWTTPLRSSDYELKVPEGSGEIVRARLIEADPATLAPLNRYVVKKGETLPTVARKLGVTKADLAEANYLSTSTKLRTGQSLIVPRAPVLLVASAEGSSTAGAIAVDTQPAEAVVPASDRGRTAKTSERATATTGASRTAPARIVHKVKAGETLTSIAKTYRTSVASLKEWNRLRSSTIQTGQRLSIVVKRTTATD